MTDLLFLVRILFRNNKELKLIHSLPGSVGFLPIAAPNRKDQKRRKSQTKHNLYFRADSEGKEEDTTSELEQQVRDLNRNPDLPLLAATPTNSDAERQQLREERQQLEEDVAAFEAEKRGKAAHEAETEEHVRHMEAEIVRLQTREKVRWLHFSVLCGNSCFLSYFKSNQQTFYEFVVN